jgi:uncharacterized membrane protein
VPIVLALSAGVLAGLRTFLAPATVGCAAGLGRLELEGTPLALLGRGATPLLLGVLALTELGVDQIPALPSRTTPPQFVGRVLSGALSGAAIGLAAGPWVGGLVAGAVGAVAGTLGGAAARERLAEAFGRDRPAALIEDAVALAGAAVVVLVA